MVHRGYNYHGLRNPRGFGHGQRSKKKTCKRQYDTLSQSGSKLWVLKALIWLGLMIIVSLLIYILTYNIMAVSKSSEPTDISNLSFTLYKNSQFAKCVQGPPERAVNCTLLEADLDNARYPNLDWIGQPDHHHFMSGPDYQITNNAQDPRPSWCDLASCLAEWKVVPSTLRHSAFELTALSAWVRLLLFGLVGLWTIKKTLSPPKVCNRRNPIDWFVLIYQTTAFGFWWWAFGTLVSNPEAAEPISLVGWIQTWNLAISFRFHPWSCFFRPGSRTRNGIVTGLYISTSLQWIATIYALRLQDDRDSIQKYDCLYPGIASAPGQSTCKDEHLCTTTWLFQNPDFETEAKVLVENDLPAEVIDYLGEIIKRLDGYLKHQLVGVYLFGSASYGAYEPDLSDLDVQAVVEHPLQTSEKQDIINCLNQSSLPCPATKLEFVVYARDTINPASRHPRFELNLNTGPHQHDHISLDPANESSHWFLLDIAMGRKLGCCIYGLGTTDAFGAIPNRWILDAMADSLAWHQENELNSTNSVFNACRSWRYIATGDFSSKLDGARWAMQQQDCPAIVKHAVEARNTGVELPAFQVLELYDMIMAKTNTIVGKDRK
ncbi:hypothetical protein F66182_1483 [Fusarium sp. NRRL 66182]|nr:hypothetical protein F66182_1483 [Fusarium sp. NRRL 66182]